ncbi:MAG: tRNA 2-thiouridine(34) synthase MnmA [Gammaproteobacteria bacterium]|nr:tRNA 2-thiouridine(34) synthase MnmA [Gammaproteobacteria bacterium]
MGAAAPRTPAAQQVAVGLSGGVDSAVAALRLRDLGYDVRGIFMKNWEEDDEGTFCSAAEDLADAQSVCVRLGIELRAVNFATEYWDRVFQTFLSAHRRGLTPNPDVLCNREIKFREFHLFAMDLGAQSVATGHYARVEHRSDGSVLCKARDPSKDQTYFLYAIDQEALARTIFPLGDLLKTEVRDIAEAAGLAVAAKRDSTGICFVGERPFREFLARFVRREAGPIYDANGNRIGTHEGAMFYTIGQRQGLGIGGHSQGSGAPWYVCAKNLEDNSLTAVQGNKHPALYRSRLVASDLHWIQGHPPALPLMCKAKIRYRQVEQPCRVLRLDAASVEVVFDDPQWAVTPGQSVVFYDGDVCLGGGTIEADHDKPNGGPESNEP